MLASSLHSKYLWLFACSYPKEPISDAYWTGVQGPRGKRASNKEEGNLEWQSTSLGEAYQSRHGSGHKHRIPSTARPESTFVHQVHAGIQDVFLKLFWRESGDIFIHRFKTKLAQLLPSLFEYLKETVWLGLTFKLPLWYWIFKPMGIPKAILSKEGLKQSPTLEDKSLSHVPCKHSWNLTQQYLLLWVVLSHLRHLPAALQITH